MIDLETITGCALFGGYIVSQAAVATAVALPVVGTPISYLLGQGHEFGLRDGIAGVQEFWTVMTKVHVSDVYRLWKNDPATNAKYDSMFRRFHR